MQETFENKEPAGEESPAAPPPPAPAPGEFSFARKARNELFEWTQAILFAVVLALFIRTFIVQAFKIPSASMEPTLLVGDHIMVNKFLYGTKIPFTALNFWHIEEPRRGDVVIFLMPQDLREKREKEEQAGEALAAGNRAEYDELKRQARGIEVRDFVKRVIGLPGETVEVRGKQIFIDGQALNDSWGQWNQDFADLRSDYGPVTVPPGHYFCMGDNRDNSQDSRIWGFVPFENLKGKAFVIYWSWDSIGGLRWNRIMALVE